MTHAEDEAYLQWLYGEVANPNRRSPRFTYWNLLRQLYKTPFVWLVPNDDNREQDGKDLRYEFLDVTGSQSATQAWLDMDCSMLEMMVGLSRALAFETDGKPTGWFFRLLENLELEECTDAKYNARIERYVDNVLNTVIWRTYHSDGRGGLFPLENPVNDQREVEIWYQLSAYLLEHF